MRIENRDKEERIRIGQAPDYWRSYSDIMAALLLMFVLLMAVLLYTSSWSTAQQAKAQAELQQQLEAKEDEVLQKEQLIEEKEQQLKELGDTVGIRRSIIDSLQIKLAEAGLDTVVDMKTGEIVMDSQTLFDFDQSKLSAQGAANLKKFLPIYLSVLLQEEYRDNISEIIVEGHTDTDGTYMYNLELSQDRAYSVVEYCLDEKKSPLKADEIEALRPMLCAKGKSYSNPIYKDADQTKVDMDASRRVVFKFQLRDEEMIDEMDRILGADQVEEQAHEKGK